MFLEFPSSDKVKVSQLSVNLKVKEVKEKDILWMATNLLRTDIHTMYMSGIIWLCHWQQDLEGQERRSILVVCKIWKNLIIRT